MHKKTPGVNKNNPGKKLSVLSNAKLITQLHQFWSILIFPILDLPQCPKLGRMA
jgi:hypothetical protein